MTVELTGFMKQITAMITALNTGDIDTNFIDSGGGWNASPLSRSDLIRELTKFKEDVTNYYQTLDTIDKDIVKHLPNAERHASIVLANVTSQLGAPANSIYIVPQISQLINKYREILLPNTSYIPTDRNILPLALKKRLKAIETNLNSLEISSQDIEKKVKDINNAAEHADEISITYEETQNIHKHLDLLKNKISQAHLTIENTCKEAEELYAKTLTFSDNCQQLVEKCEEAYRITTTKGLASAFDQRTKTTESSIRWWVAALFVAMISAATLASLRFESIQSKLISTSPDWLAIIVEIILSALSLGGPVWIAWISTKQIGQRYKIVEDYAFKASTAKAYEGYRKEAVNLDDEFLKRLFNAALTRLEESPVRLLEQRNNCSPIHDFFNSKTAEKGLEVATELSKDINSIKKSIAPTE
jgi:hypothetical protein